VSPHEANSSPPPNVTVVDAAAVHVVPKSVERTVPIAPRRPADPTKVTPRHDPSTAQCMVSNPLAATAVGTWGSWLHVIPPSPVVKKVPMLG
jgi:hypothetical protein